jgi:surface polysaccharide O-acyltransferase-like enzyme
MSQKKTSIFYIDFLRFIAATAVVLIHVLGPFRKLYGSIPEAEWLAAASINGATRWAVPVFMMISGALLLSTNREFNAKHYLVRRLSKVAIPLVGWTIIYACITGLLGAGFSDFIKVIQESPNNPAWYHLWFFYDFIPLYFVVPFLMLALKKLDNEYIKMILVTFVVLFLMKWLKVESFLQENLILYTGYFILGWYLFNRDNSKEVKYWVIAGVSMLILNIFGTWIIALETGKYSSLFMGYKTLNTMIIGGMLFVLAQTYAQNIQGNVRSFISLVAKYSLGIYLLHPILLIPIRNIENGYYDFFGTNWIAIPVISIIVMMISLLLTIVLAKIPVVNRLVP